MSPVKLPAPHRFTPVILITVSFLLLVMPAAWVQKLRDGMVTVMSPLDRALAPGARAFFQFPALLVERADRREELQRLRTSLRQIEIEKAAALARALELERRLESVSAYRSAVGQDQGFAPLPAGILEKPSRILSARGGALRDGLLIDSGSRDGVSLGDAVVHRYAVVGRIVAVGFSTSQVQLVTDPGFRTGAVTADTQVEGLLRGESAADCVLEHIPEGQSVKEGEFVLTSGFGGSFPRGLVIGRVQQSLSSYDARLPRVLVTPAIVQEELDTVLVLVRTGTVLP